MIKVSAPGRICLFGEHQDYFGLPVISAAINLRIRIEGNRNNDECFNIDLPDIGEREVIGLSSDFKPEKERDYLRSSLRVLRRHGYEFIKGYNCSIRSSIPIGKGVSSSSAMVVAWIRFLTAVSENKIKITNDELAELAYEAEVKEFNEPGGMQDHYCASLGGLLYIDSKRKKVATPVNIELKGFVIGDSLAQKDTKGVLGRIKSNVYSGIEKIREDLKDFDLAETGLSEIKDILKKLPHEAGQKLEATIMTRDLTKEVREFMGKGRIDNKALGSWLDRQHSILKNGLEITTKRIEELIAAAKSAGALGCKINGSGGGGCFLAFAPGREKNVISAIEGSGGKGYRVEIDRGVCSEGDENVYSQH